jgi:excinuclease UvrABC nuclease subunit
MIIDKTSNTTIIYGSNLPEEIKEMLNRILNDSFDGDWRDMFETLMYNAVEEEEYEMAAEFRDCILGIDTFLEQSKYQSN